MAKKPFVVVLHPRHWARPEYQKESKLEIEHVSIGGEVPKKRKGTPTFDGYADMATKEGKNELFDLFKRRKPDLFLFWMHGNFRPADLRQLKERSPKTKFIFWYGNHRYSVSGAVRNMAPWTDSVLLNSEHPQQLRMYRRAGFQTFTLWDGFDPKDVRLRESAPKYDVVFGGNSYMEPAKAEPKLDFPGGKIRFDFICECHRRFKTMVRSGHPKFWPFPCEPEVFHPKYTDFLREGKITVNLNHFPEFTRAYTRRTIRCIFARRLHVTLYIPGMERDFTNHKDIVWFNEIEEGLDQIRYYLDHDEERERIADRCYQTALKKFTFKHRLRDFERIASKVLGRSL